VAAFTECSIVNIMLGRSTVSVNTVFKLCMFYIQTKTCVYCVCCCSRRAANAMVGRARTTPLQLQHVQMLHSWVLIWLTHAEAAIMPLVYFYIISV